MKLFGAKKTLTTIENAVQWLSLQNKIDKLLIKFNRYKLQRKNENKDTTQTQIIFDDSRYYRTQWKLTLKTWEKY